MCLLLSMLLMILLEILIFIMIFMLWIKFQCPMPGSVVLSTMFSSVIHPFQTIL